MKTIGLLGGTSWPSTLLYYEKLNKIINAKLGGFHSARILLYNIDYHEIKSSYTANWQNVEKLLEKEINFLLRKEPDCLLICNNTLHKALDNLKLITNIPIFHAGFLCAREGFYRNYKSILLLGTKFTMEDGFFAQYFDNFGIKVIIPDAEDRLQIQHIQAKIASGEKNSEFFENFKTINMRYTADAVCLACTELPLYINAQNCNIPIINPIDLQCNAAIEFSLKS